PGSPAFVFVARRWHDHLDHPLVGWMGHARPFAFAPGYDPAPGPSAMLTGTPPILAFAALEAALDVFDGADLEALFARQVELSALALLVLASLHDATPTLSGRYVVPFVPALALACAWPSQRLSARSSQMMQWVVLGAALALVLVETGRLRPRSSRELPLYPEWSVAELERVAAELKRRDMSWSAAVLALQGPNTTAELGFFSSALEPGGPEEGGAKEGGPKEGAPTRGLLLLALTPAQLLSLRDELPAEATILELEDMRVLLLETSARSDRRGTKLCRDAGDCTEVLLTVTSRVYQAHLNAWVGATTAEGWLAGEAREGAEGATIDEAMWRVPVQPGPAATAMLSSLLPERCAWHFVAAEGLELPEPLPARVITLPAGATGTLLVARSGLHDEQCREHGLVPPSIIELAPEWAGLRALLDPSRVQR
ncbi:MAG: hypothetical protein KC431_30835, partial [Myxococcales bacterium]|nr:hypothetical protein [Myxococcales bacterium]